MNHQALRFELMDETLPDAELCAELQPFLELLPLRYSFEIM